AMTSAPSMARNAAARIASCRRYSGSSKPGESVNMNCVSPCVSRPTTGRRVDCGFGETIARCSPIKAFRSEDFPTLGRPASTIVPHRVIEEKATVSRENVKERRHEKNVTENRRRFSVTSLCNVSPRRLLLDVFLKLKAGGGLL